RAPAMACSATRRWHRSRSGERSSRRPYLAQPHSSRISRLDRLASCSARRSPPVGSSPMALILLFALLFGLMFLGAPIFIAMLTSALVTLAVSGLGSATVIPTQMAAGVSQLQLLAIPFFILMGELMARAGLTQRIVDLLMIFFGR